MKKIYLVLLLILASVGCKAQETNKSNEYTLITYNVENLFDADGIAIYDDYNTTDDKGKPLYTKEDVLTKIEHAVRVFQQYNNGKGPHIATVVELESDYTPGSEESQWMDADDFLAKYKSTTLKKMLGDQFDKEIASLPSHLLLLKGMVDAEMRNYNVEVGYSPKDEKGLPTTVQKTAIFSTFPIIRDKTKIHPLKRARPILETWIDVDGNELVVFVNHWKSGASSWDMEQIRLQNAEVLRNRLDELLKEDPSIDFVLAGDFNSDYNQKARYDFDRTAINDVLKSTGDEAKVSETGTSEVFNLWYEYPIEKRGSDTYRGYWGTLMQIMISSGMYNTEGVYYVDNSFDRGDFEFNTFASSGEPKRWSSTFSGSGYSDHLPLSMKFKTKATDTSDKNILANTSINSISKNDDESWKPIPVQYQIPSKFKTEAEFIDGDPTTNQTFYDEYFYLTATVTDRYDFIVNGTTFDVYTPSFKLEDVLSDFKGTNKEIKFYGRFSQYRGNWQFIVESPEFLILR